MHEKEVKNQAEHDELPVDTNEEANPVYQEENLQPQEENVESDGNETEKIKAELSEQKDKYIRLFAEFDNYKRRTSREAMELRQTAGKEIIISMLDILDDMDRAEQQLKESNVDAAISDGVLLVFDKFRKTLQSRGLKPIETLHSDFDVEKDEAVSEIEVPDKKLKGKVVAELQKGYMLNDKLIRFAKVVVGK
ncbi:nucleotide exchange factor GrpE [Hanamia caeni]|uniref:Protein GrpE n=1 Tax=Hanamia caeni TaxID=2294116 RepID=A0A3M9N7T7_9BACT|nr:nucleotide exchange factor GrpE [Hanamia caeni]RNI33839.1 nucleotide exchange factor GrpE [Hanamia caeni]